MNPNSNNTTDIAQPPGAHDNQRYPDQNTGYSPQGQQPARGQHTNAHDTDIAQPSGAYDNQRYPDQNAVDPTQGQQPASRGQHTTDRNVHEPGTAQPPGPYDKQSYADHNPAYPPGGQQLGGQRPGGQQLGGQQLGGQQPAPIGQHDRNYRSGGTVEQDGTQINQGQHGVAPQIGQHDPNHGYGRTVGQDGAQINQGKYGAAPPTSLTGATGAGGQRVDDPDTPVNNINSNNSGSTTSNPSLTRMIGKAQSALGSLIDSESLRTKGLQKEQGANASNIQNLEIAQAERLEKEALMHRERAVGQGAHPAHSVLGGPKRTYN